MKEFTVIYLRSTDNMLCERIIKSGDIVGAISQLSNYEINPNDVLKVEVRPIPFAV